MPDPASRESCVAGVHGIDVSHLYGSGLERMLLLVKDLGPEGQKAYDKLINDNIVRGLLLIHGLHPLSLDIRLRQALDKVRPYMESHGGNVEVLSLENDFARLRLQGSCKSCPSSSVTMELAVRQAIEEACPDLQGFEVERRRLRPRHGGRRTSLTPRPTWTLIENAAQLHDGGLMQVHAAARRPLLFFANWMRSF